MIAQNLSHTKRCFTLFTTDFNETISELFVFSRYTQGGCRRRHFQFSTKSQQSLLESGWLVGCRLKANCPLMGPRPIGGVPSVGDLSKGS